MTADDQACTPLTDDSGEVIGRARVSVHLSEEGRQALLALVQAAIRMQAERDAADPEAATERARRYDTGQRRWLKRLRGEP